MEETISGDKRSFFLSLFIITHRAATKSTWQIEPIMSITGVTDLTLKMSFGAGTANHMKFGIITIKKSTNPEKSKPNLYFFKSIILR